MSCIAYPLMTLPLLGLAALSACAQAPRDAATGIAAPHCDAAVYQSLVGQNIGAVSLPAGLPQRIISPGEVVAGDADPARLTIFVDPKGWIGRVHCG